MKKSPSELMKELKFIKAEVREIQNQDMHESTERVTSYDSKPEHLKYDYEDNRKKISKLYERERKIHDLLSAFNLSTKLPDYDLTVSEALVRLGQLKDEINTLTYMASRRQSSLTEDYGENRFEACGYDVAKTKLDLKALQRERSDLQIAIDKINLTSSIDC